jgi:hypothetical protein
VRTGTENPIDLLPNPADVIQHRIEIRPERNQEFQTDPGVRFVELRQLRGGSRKVTGDLAQGRFVEVTVILGGRAGNVQPHRPESLE